MSPHFLIILCLISHLHARGGSRGGTSRSTSHSYPRSTGLSGNNNQAPSYQNIHKYPSSTGMSGNSNQASSYQNVHKYPSSTGVSGHSETKSYSTSHHTHYHYTQPQQISYGSTQYPVFRGTPPVYIYQYKESGSKFDNLLTGLALYNLGRMSANNHNYDYNRDHRYDSQNHRNNAGEMCKFAIHKLNGEREETRIDCMLMSSFIFDAEREKQQNVNIVNSVSVVQTTQGNSTLTIKNTTILDAREVKGPSISVSKGMTCFMIRVSRDTSMLQKKVDCGLLQEYAVKSLQYRNSCERVVPVPTIFLLIIIFDMFVLLISL